MWIKDCGVFCLSIWFDVILISISCGYYISLLCTNTQSFLMLERIRRPCRREILIFLIRNRKPLLHLLNNLGYFLGIEKHLGF
ncbi:hypothetical protein E4K39_10100 [Neisseria meningitidis]|uniref:Uncharacterized protein n=1 Tax=Neisseria meningitidis TaxID=487 RepID=A0A1V3SM89_NEIME|nr:hypothetical protein A6J53_06700 [Neisseria meningitidis]EJU65653.1 hypothetical protein NMEN98008_1720 [Neisseria meningitidis 98008]EOC08861.1 hypothetical protein NM73696_2176 [Neisseria meningitidis 73696]EOC13444.1 hypothetical protein NM81858_1833 [Neisseria meningitidis 81858]ARB71248.1 hypothetical protein A6J54_05405 [Neisseria meningitidis]